MDIQQTIQNLALERFHLSTLRPFQQLVIHRILEQDTPACGDQGMLVILPTGSGKSICYMLPSLLVKGITILVFPLLSLMNDQINRLEHSGIAYACIRGGQTKEQRGGAWSQLETGKANVVVTNAECLTNSAVLNQLARFHISLVVLDEVHTIVKWGKTFRPSFEVLGSAIEHLHTQQILAFTATADDEVLQGLEKSIFYRRKPHVVHGSSDRPNIVYHAERTLNKDHSVSQILRTSQSRPAVVFCATREDTEQACAAFLLSNEQIPTRYYHAGLSRASRVSLETWFNKQEKGVLFSTNAFGMGVDKPNIRTIIHRTPSGDVLSFLQESGRAGRDGEVAHSYVLLHWPLSSKQHDTSIQEIFSSNHECIRKALLARLAEQIDFCCGCDICNKTVHLQPEAFEVLVRTVGFSPLKYTKSQLSHTLVTHLPWDSRSGILSNWKENELKRAIAILIEQDVLRVSKIPRHALYRAFHAKKTKIISTD